MYYGRKGANIFIACEVGGGIGVLPLNNLVCVHVLFIVWLKSLLWIMRVDPVDDCVYVSR